jgi:hypothetical protein
VPVVFQKSKKYKKHSLNPGNYHDDLVLTDAEQQMFDQGVQRIQPLFSRGFDEYDAYRRFMKGS